MTTMARLKSPVPEIMSPNHPI